MRAQLAGYLKLDFVSGNDHIQGTQLFIVYSDPISDVVGNRVDKIFVKKQIDLPTLNPGDLLDISYNNKGKAEAVTVVPAAKA